MSSDLRVVINDGMDAQELLCLMMDIEARLYINPGLSWAFLAGGPGTFDVENISEEEVAEIAAMVKEDYNDGIGLIEYPRQGGQTRVIQ